MTSVDSGVETGNDSNDSAQPENIPNQALNKVTAAITSTDKQLTITQKQESKIVESDALSPLTKSVTKSFVITDHSVIKNPVRYQYDGITIDAPRSIVVYNINSDLPTSLQFKFPANFAFPAQETLTKESTSKFERFESGQLKAFYKKSRPNKYKYYHMIACYETAWERRMRLAATTNNVELMKSLLEKGHSPNNSDDSKRTPLHLAACRGFTEIVKLLLEHGADPNRVDSLSNTPLHLAAVTCKYEVITLLLKAGADVLSSDRHGYNPLQLAQSKLRMLQNCHGSDMELIKAEVHKIVDMLLAYLQKQKDVNEQIEELSSFCSRISLSNTTDQVQDDLKELLASIDALNLTT